MGLKRKYDVYNKQVKKLEGGALVCYTLISDYYNEACNKAHDALVEYTGNFCRENNLTIEMGITPTECIKSEKYQQLKKEYNVSFANLRKFNSMFKLKHRGWG